MLLLGGGILFLIGLVSFISLLIYAIKEFKKDETQIQRKILFLVLELIDVSLGRSVAGFAIIFSLGAMLIGLVLIIGSFH